jgi:hypothetical protein
VIRPPLGRLRDRDAIVAIERPKSAIKIDAGSGTCPTIASNAPTPFAELKSCLKSLKSA